MTSEERRGPTPAGGVRSRAFYTDAQGRPAEKSVATNMRIVEYDAAGEAIRTTYGRLRRQAGASRPSPPSPA